MIYDLTITVRATATGWFLSMSIKYRGACGKRCMKTFAQEYTTQEEANAASRHLAKKWVREAKVEGGAS